MKVYVAGPLSMGGRIPPEKVLENVNRAIDAGVALVRQGHVPFIPHLTHWFDARAREIGVDFTHDDYMRWDLEWLACCDAILYLGSSPGADEELEFAMRRGLSVFLSVEEAING